MSLDLSILEIAADIIDETGRSPIADQVRELKGRVERLVERDRIAQEQNREMIEGYIESPFRTAMDRLTFFNQLQIAIDEHHQRTAIRIKDQQPVLKDSRSTLVVNPGDITK